MAAIPPKSFFSSLKLHVLLMSYHPKYALWSLSSMLFCPFMHYGSKFSVKVNYKYRDGPIKSTETRQGLKHKKTILIQKNHDKVRLLHSQATEVEQSSVLL